MNPAIGPVSGDLVLKLFIGAAIGGALWWLARKVQTEGIASILPTIPEELNPASTKNAVYQAVSAPFDGSLGARIWEWTHPSQRAEEDKAIGADTRRQLDSLHVSPFWNQDAVTYAFGA